ncbi:hypothetical protein [Paenibacillus solani]|uniref:Uncharacterized protein n=1 Tax=Paenibacillus solani TaxID=1705565 RepID=A0A0M1N1K6_9BACL|nr:hypothetical protein [Paenibacillus solani]KOR76038.1 hypothetical protein AM231_25680 [Paenibacillus solani]
MLRINCYSSSIAGLIRAMMSDICKLVTMKNGAVRLTLKGIRYFFSGVSKGKRDVQIVKESGGTFVLLNYYTIRNDITESWKENLINLGFDYKCVILDPGEKTLHESILKGRQVAGRFIFMKKLLGRKKKIVITRIPLDERVGPSKELQVIMKKAEKILGKKLDQKK